MTTRDRKKVGEWEARGKRVNTTGVGSWVNRIITLFSFCVLHLVSLSCILHQTRSVQLCVRFARRMLDDLVLGLSEFFCKLVAINLPTRILRTSYVLSLTCPHLIFFCFHSLAFVLLSLPPQ